MSKLPLSVFIITKNEEDRIGECLDSVIDLADDIIVIDSGSNDKTIEIVKSKGVKIVHNDWPGYVKQKIYGESLCSNDWILNIDADESLTKELQKEIRDLFAGIVDNYRAYRLNIRIAHRFDKKPRLFAPQNNPIRLYNINSAGFFNSDVNACHDAVKTKDSHVRICQLKSIVLHKSGRSLHHLIDKGNYYTTLQSKDFYNIGREMPSRIRILLELPLSFFKIYFLRRYFVFGFNGFIDSVTLAFLKFVRIAKYREFLKDHTNT